MLRKLDILLAEDNPDHAELTMGTLQGFGASNRVVLVRNGELVLHYLRGEPPYDTAPRVRPDLIMLDIKMPRMNGKEALREIKSDPALCGIPVIMITTSSSDEEIRECFELGASSYVTKPVEYEDFARKLEELRHYWSHVSELPAGGAGR